MKLRYNAKMLSLKQLVYNMLIKCEGIWEKLSFNIKKFSVTYYNNKMSDN